MLFKPLTKMSLAYDKIGILGFQGSGKTFTAVEIAIGLHKYIKSKKPIFFADTETGSDWALEKFKAHKIELMVTKTRAFKNLTPIIREAEKMSDILIIDSITHFWVEEVTAYRSANNVKFMQVYHWVPIKQEWHREFAEPFVNSKLHIIVCGRAGYEFDYAEDDGGKKVLMKTGIKMKAEGEFGFEPNLVIEMKKITENEHLIHVGIILKDRNMDIKTSLDGKHIQNPKFKDFLPHFQVLNIGGEHIGFEIGTSEDIFESNGNSYMIQKQQQTIYMEEIKGELEAAYPGTSKDMQQKKAALKKWAYGTYSDTAIGNMSPDKIKSGLSIILDILNMPSEEREKYITEEIIPKLINLKNEKAS